MYKGKIIIMNKDFIGLLKDSFENMDKLDMEQVQILVSETNRYFSMLTSVLSSGDSEAKESALNEALEIKRFLESNASIISQASGYEPITEQEKALWEEMQEGLNISGKRKKNISHKLKPIKMS